MARADAGDMLQRDLGHDDAHDAHDATFSLRSRVNDEGHAPPDEALATH